MGTRKVFLVDLRAPTRKIKEIDAKIITRTLTWAQDSRGNRHLLGASAFYNLAGAQRTKLGLLLKIQKSPYLRRHAFQFWAGANHQLQEYKKIGKIE